MNRSNPILINGSEYTPLQRKIIRFAYEKITEHCPAGNKSLHASILTIGKEIEVYGVNDEKNSYGNSSFGYLSIHSEFSCIRKYLRDFPIDWLSDYTMWNIRFNRYNEIALSRPCYKCAYMLSVFQPKRLFYSDESGRFRPWQS